MCRPFLAFEKFFNKMLTFFCLRTEKLTCVNAIFPAILYNCGERKEDAMHTNYDVLGMADLSADYTKMHDTTVLSVTEEREGEVQGFGRVGKLPREMTLREYAQLVKESLKLNDVKVYGNLDSMVKCAAVCTGSGKSMIKDVIKAGADVYVTGDIDHHTGIDTVAQGLALIDAGHYGTEYIFMDAMKKELTQAFPELKISCAEVKSPYTIL